MELLVTRIQVDPGFAELAARIAIKDLAIFDALCRSSDVDASELQQIAGKAVDAIRKLSQFMGVPVLVG